MILHLFILSDRNNVGQKTKKAIEILSDSATNLGHTLRVIYANECQIRLDKKPEILVQNHELKTMNVLIVKANIPASKLHFKSKIIKQFEMTGIPIVNNEQAVLNAKNKIRTLQILSEKKIPIPKSYVILSAEYIDNVVKDIGKFPVILKTVSGSQGIGVSIIESKRTLRSVIEMVSREDFSGPLIVQEYIKEARGKDLRIFIVGNKIVGAMERISTKRGEFRSNFHLGGKVKLAELTKKEKTIALAASKACGLDFSGVDILRTKSGPKVIEVNASPGLEGISKATNKDIAGEIIKFAVTKAKKTRAKN